MSRIGEGAISDRNMITALMTKNRTYGPERDIHMLVPANLDGIIRDPKRLRAVTMLDPEQFDYLCVRFAQRVAERGLYRLFWDDDARASDPGTRSRLYARHALLMSLLHKREAITEATLGVFFGIDRGTASRYLKVVNGVLVEMLPTARNLTGTIRGIYERNGGAEGGSAEPGAGPPFRTGPPRRSRPPPGQPPSGPGRSPRPGRRPPSPRPTSRRPPP